MMGDSHPFAEKCLLVLGIGFLVAAGVIYTMASDLESAPRRRKRGHAPQVWTFPGPPGRLHCASFLTGLAVLSAAVSVTSAFVGARDALHVWLRSSHFVATAAIGGAIAVVVADTLARTVVAPTEVPVGAVTAIVGAADSSSPPPPEASMVPLISCAHLAEAGRLANEIRLSVEQVSYATRQTRPAPLFRRWKPQVSGPAGEIVAISAELQRQSTL